MRLETQIVLGILTLSIYINYMIVIFIIPLVILLLYVRQYYLNTSNDLKRLDGILRSPVIIHVNNTLVGMITIRSSQTVDIIRKEFHKLLDNNNRAYFVYLCVTRWFQIR